MAIALMTKMRRRVFCRCAVTKAKAIIASADTAKWNQAPRENASSSATTSTPSIKTSMIRRRRTSMRSISTSAGQIRKGP